MGKRSIAPPIRIKRENWRGKGYQNVARESGRFVKVSRWTGRSSSQEFYDALFNRNFSLDNHLRYGYTVIARDQSGVRKPHMVYSSSLVEIGPRGSSQRKQFYRTIKKLFEKYNLELTHIHLIATWDNKYGTRIL